MKNRTQENFTKIKTLIVEIYNISVVADYFCSNQNDIEELDNISPIIKTLRKKADNLNSIFIDCNTFDDFANF